MTTVRFGRVVHLVREKADPAALFRIGLEAIEPGTGQLISDPVTDYEGSGIAFEVGDSLFGKLRPYLAKAWLADRDGAAVGDFHVYRPTNRIYPEYLRWVLLAKNFLDPVVSSVFGAKMPRADWEFIRNVEIHVPTLDKQGAIADFLDRETARIDSLIEEQEKLVRLLAERRTAVMSEPFRQAQPTMPLGAALEALIDHRGKTPGKVGAKSDDFTDEGIPVVSAIHVKDGLISWGERERYVPRWMFEKWMPVKLRAEDVLLTSEAPLGNVAQVPTDAPLVLSQRLFALRGRDGVLNSTYLRCYLESDRGQALLRDGASGSTVSGIRQSRLVRIPVPVPPLDVQHRVAKEIRDQTAKIDEIVAAAERFIELSKERRSALITAAVTGQIDVLGVV